MGGGGGGGGQDRRPDSQVTARANFTCFSVTEWPLSGHLEGIQLGECSLYNVHTILAVGTKQALLLSVFDLEVTDCS